MKSVTTSPWPAARIQCGAGQELAGGIAPNLFFIANNWFILHAPIVSLTTGNAQKSNRVGSGNCVSKGEEGAQWGLPSGATVVPNREPARSQVRKQRQRRILRSLRRRGLGLAGHVRLNLAPRLAQAVIVRLVSVSVGKPAGICQP